MNFPPDSSSLTLEKSRKSVKIAVYASLGVAACVCLPLFVAAATFVLLFIILPVFLIFGVPVQVLHLVLRNFSTSTRFPTERLDPPVELQRSSAGSTRHGSRSAASTRSSSRFIDPDEATFAFNSSQLPSVEETPRSILGLLLTDGNESAGAPTPSNAGTLEQNPFVESPIDYILPPRTSTLEQLSGELLEEVARHLPEHSLSTLALVSKRFGSQFRFRRLHSGTEDCPLPTFSIIKNEPRLGEFTVRLVVHSTFFRPPANVQWLLEGSEESVCKTSWNSTEVKKQQLLESVLRACPRVRSLTWNEGNLPLSPGVLSAVHALCTTSLRDLDVPVGCRLIGHLSESLAPDTMRLNSLTLRGGFPEGSSDPIVGLFLLSKQIRCIYLVYPNFGVSREDARIVLSVFLQEHSPVQRIIFVKPLDLETVDIPIRHARELFIKDPTSSAFDLMILFHQFRFQTPVAGSVLSNLTALSFQTDSLSMFGDAGNVPVPDALIQGIQGLCDVISASPNLLIFSLNAKVVPGWGWGRTSGIPQNLMSAITPRRKLISFSITAFALKREQLQTVCESFPQLRHLCVFMDGEAVKISTYSQHFSKLVHLVALDVALKSSDVRCACGHERDIRIPHRDEGSAMGRLCRRVRPPMALAVVRLSQGHWPPSQGFNADSPLDSELRWIGLFGEAVRRLEGVCGLCETEAELVERAFDPETWLDVA